MSKSAPHDLACDCGACRNAHGLCAKCGKEPKGDGMSWGKTCDRTAVNRERLKTGMRPLNPQEYEDLLGRLH